MKRLGAWLGLAVVLMGAFVLGQEKEQKEKPQGQAVALSDFMRRKLDHCQKAMEGIVVEDYDLIAESAQAMSLLSLDASWKVLQTPEYFERSTEFRRTANTLDRMGRDHNVDGAALTYVQLTTQCFDCHKYVRETKERKKR